ncbi:M56 family metallopeptidase [Kordiimonas aquimaris]|uniref:M56 family metallopeptidase n=1 Tax=Kordiimonas aquimaris TaxID=707591 RepID=UPI0021D2CEF7|nr:M56 family metallopeptidase [Kordiimonas aquimaris]
MIEQIIIDLPFVGLFIKFMIASTCLLGGVWLMEKAGIINTPDIAEMAWKLAIAASFISVLPISITPSNITVPLSENAAQVARSQSPLAVQAPNTNAGLLQNSPPNYNNGSDSETTVLPPAPEAPVRASGTPITDVNSYEPSPTLMGGAETSDNEASFSFTMLLAITWLLLAAIALSALALSYRRAIASLGTRTRVDAEHDANKALRAICVEADIRHVPYLSRSDDINSPVCLPRREICLPAWAFEDMDSKALNSLIAHELAHMLRRDPAQIIFLQTLCRICFFQPLFAVARRRLEDCAELAADEWAAKQLSSANTVAEALYTCAQKITQKRQIQWGLAMAGDKSILRQRVERLVNADTSKFEGASTLKRTGVSLAIAAVVLATPGIEFATALTTDAPDNIVANADKEFRLYTPADGSGTIIIPVSKVNEPSLSHEEPSHIYIENDNSGIETGNMHWSDDNNSVKVSWDGRFTISEDERSIASIEEDGALQIRTNFGNDRRRIRFFNDEGTLDTTYWEDGKKTEFDAEGEEWLAITVQHLIQNTAIDMEKRVARYLREGGTDAALERLSDVKSDYVKRIFTAHLLRQAEFSEPQFRKLLSNIRTMESDYEVRLTLLEMMNTGTLTPRNLNEALDIAKNLDSDYEMRLTLSPMLERFSIDDKSMNKLLDLAKTIQSDYELRLLLSEATHNEFSEENVAKLLEVTESIESDYELRLLLEDVSEIEGMTGKVMEDLVNSLKSIESDYEKRLALESIVEEAEMLTTKAWKNVIEQAEAMGSDRAKRLVLEQIRDELPNEKALRDAWQKAAKSISGKYERNLLLDDSE